MRLELPYPISANRYWRTAARGGRAITYISGEAKAYREAVELIYSQSYGVRKPLDVPIAMTLHLYGPRPQDWAKRERKEGPLWWLAARCIDLGNAEKVLSDALQGIAYENDGQIVEQRKYRMPPDERGPRVVVQVTIWSGIHAE